MKRTLQIETDRLTQVNIVRYCIFGSTAKKGMEYIEMFLKVCVWILCKVYSDKCVYFFDIWCDLGYFKSPYVKINIHNCLYIQDAVSCGPNLSQLAQAI